jgi:hypothetical protein
MRKKNRKLPCRKIVLRLPDLDQSKSAVLNSLSSPSSRRNYKFAMEQFITWYCSGPLAEFIQGTKGIEDRTYPRRCLLRYGLAFAGPIPRSTR